MTHEQNRIAIELIVELIHDAHEKLDKDMQRWDFAIGKLMKVDKGVAGNLIKKRDTVKAAQKAVITFLQDSRKVLNDDFHPEISRACDFWNEKLNVNQ